MSFGAYEFASELTVVSDSLGRTYRFSDKSGRLNERSFIPLAKFFCTKRGDGFELTQGGGGKRCVGEPAKEYAEQEAKAIEEANDHRLACLTACNAGD